MSGTMATNSQSYNVDAAIRPTVRDRSPDAPVGRGGCCNGFLRFGSRQRGKRIVPASRMHDVSNSSSRPRGANGGSQSGASNQYASLSPSLLAPPSSPASFQNSAVQSSAQSPATFPIALSVPSATSQIPLETTATMFQMGPYAHETALVSPPVFSTFTTAPSTAPFTPPPELATHVTTPSSPDVPFAQLLASSFGTKGSSRLQPLPTYSASPFASPDIFAADDLQAAYQLFPGSPLAHLLSPTSRTGESTPVPDLEVSSQCTPCPDFENSVQAVASMFFPGSSLVTTATAAVDAESLVSQALHSSSFQDTRGKNQLLSTTISSFVDCEDDPSKPKIGGHVGRDLGELSMNVANEGSDVCQQTKCLTIIGSHTDYRRVEEDFIESNGDHGKKKEHGISGFLSDHLHSLDHQQGNLVSYDAADRNLGHITVVCNIGCADSMRRCPSMMGSVGSMVNREVHSLKFKSSLLGPSNGDSVAWGALASDSPLTKLTIPQISMGEKGTSQSPIHARSSGNDSASWSGPTAMFGMSDSADFVRLQHVSVATPTKVYFDTKNAPQSDSTDQQLRTEFDCGEQNTEDFWGRCEHLERASKQASDSEVRGSNLQRAAIECTYEVGAVGGYVASQC